VPSSSAIREQSMSLREIVGKILDEFYTIVAVTIEHIIELVIILAMYAAMIFASWLLLQWLLGRVFGG
jgi:hypothetical protein